MPGRSVGLVAHHVGVLAEEAGGCPRDAPALTLARAVRGGIVNSVQVGLQLEAERLADGLPDAGLRGSPGDLPAVPADLKAQRAAASVTTCTGADNGAVSPAGR